MIVSRRNVMTGLLGALGLTLPEAKPSGRFPRAWNLEFIPPGFTPGKKAWQGAWIASCDATQEIVVSHFSERPEVINAFGHSINLIEFAKERLELKLREIETTPPLTPPDEYTWRHVDA